MAHSENFHENHIAIYEKPINVYWEYKNVFLIILIMMEHCERRRQARFAVPNFLSIVHYPRRLPHNIFFF